MIHLDALGLPVYDTFENLGYFNSKCGNESFLVKILWVFCGVPVGLVNSGC